MTAPHVSEGLSLGRGRTGQVRGTYPSDLFREEAPTKWSAVPPGRAGRRAAASSVAPI